MKKTLLIILTFAILVTSCDKKSKYIGTWFFSDTKSEYYVNPPIKLIITEDSVEFIRYHFKPSSKYAFHLQDNNLVIGNDLIKTKFQKGTLIINDRLHFFKGNSIEISKGIGFIDPKIEINLPEIETTNLIKYTKNLPTTYVRYGKRHDNKEFALELNDKYSDIKSLYSFLADLHNDKNNFNYIQQKNYFYCDKDAKMKDLEKIFLAMSSANQRSIAFVSESKFLTKDSLALNYEDSFLGTRISKLEDHSYFNSIFDNHGEVPLMLDSHFNQFYGKPNNYPNVISLVKNKFYFNGVEFKKKDLKKLLRNDIENKNNTLSLYDLESDYYHFLDLQIAIRSTYNSIREKRAIKKYNASLNELTKDQLDSIKTETPVKNIWSYSIPHYKSIVKNGHYFFGMKVKPMNSILPINMDSSSSKD